MSPILEAIGVVAHESASAPPFSLAIAAGEIVGLLFPPGKPRAPILRVLRGLDAAAGGDVRFRGGARIVDAATGPSLAEALSMQADLILLDAGGDGADRNTWARIAGERALGTSFLVATANLDHACRADRVSMASWDMDALTGAVTALLPEMAVGKKEFVALADGHHRRRGTLAVDLRRLNVGARALLTEMGHRARAGEETLALHTAQWRLAGVSLGDDVLDAAVAEAHRR